MVKALAAQQFVQAKQHRVTGVEVYAAIDPRAVKAHLPVPTPLLADWIERWLLRKIDVAASTHAEYARMLRRRVVSDLGHLQVGEISRADHLDDWKAGLARTLSPATVHKHWAVFSEVMRDAVPRYRLDNPLARPAGQRGNGLPRLLPHQACFLTPSEATILVDHCRPEIRDLVRVVLGTGMRLGELLGLRAGAVKLGGKTPLVRVEHTLQRGGRFSVPKTAAAWRSVGLAPSTAALLAHLRVGKGSDELIFPAPEGGPWDANNFRYRFWQPSVVAAGRCEQHPSAGGARRSAVSTCGCESRLHKVPRFHDLRHSHVAYLIDAAWDFYMIQLRLGHASIKTTFDIYGHLLPHGEHHRLADLDERLPRTACVAVRAVRRVGLRAGSHATPTAYRRKIGGGAWRFSRSGWGRRSCP
ncbi:tyrosine-type recombinase/integrase [Actinoplanes sp. NPDC051470]|uniref:tyrosine-type recombinase/integrase n=1 Tax=Actinoplanes sp. NPDC051470 TaxID=3157224 RepID=UPI0034471579